MNRVKDFVTNPFEHASPRRDLLAALLVAVILVPQGMAYASLAGLPPIYGLYAAFVPLIVYPFFGSSRHLSVGPVALVSIILYTGLSNLAVPGSEEFIQLALLTALVAGIIQILLGVFRMGFLINFLSDPVIHGFTTAAAIIIILSQLKALLGIAITGNLNAIEIFKALIYNLPYAHVTTSIIGLATLIFLLILKRIKKSFPASLCAIIIGTVLVYAFQLHHDEVSIIGEVPAGLPGLTGDFIIFDKILSILPLAGVICLISFIESLAISKSISARNNHYKIDANKELFGLGMAKLIGSFFQAFPNTGSFSRSAINDEAGGRSGLSSLITAGFIGLILLFFTQLFYYLPKTILAAIVISAVLGLLNFSYAKNLFHLDRKDFYVFLTTCILTLIFGIQTGVLTGIVLSIIMILHKTSKPHHAILGQLPGTHSFRNINRYPEAITNEDTLIIRYDQDIYFGNAQHFQSKIIELLDRHGKAKSFILNAGVISSIDSTGISQMKLLLDTLEARNVRLFLTHLRGPVRDKLSETGLLQRIGADNIYLTVHDAVYRKETIGTRSQISKGYAAQFGDDPINNIIEE